jgi:hypothetical protein
VDGCEDIAHIVILFLAVPEAGKARRGAKFKRSRSLTRSEIDRLI